MGTGDPVTAARGDGDAVERVVRTAPLGLRPVDGQTGEPVAGLWVTCRTSGARPRDAVETPRGCYVLGDLPALVLSENTDPGPSYWYQPPQVRSGVVEIRDPHRRYHPVRFSTVLPCHDLARAGCLGPPWLPGTATAADGEGVIPLRSTCARPVPAGFAAVRAQLTTAAGAPAAWAALFVTPLGGRTAVGVADGAGRVAVLLPWPALGPDHSDRPSSDWEWPVAVTACYGLASEDGTVPVAAADGVPDLCDLARQRPAGILSEPGVPLPVPRLRFGRDLVLRSARRSELVLDSPA